MPVLLRQRGPAAAEDEQQIAAAERRLGGRNQALVKAADEPVLGDAQNEGAATCPVCAFC